MVKKDVTSFKDVEAVLAGFVPPPGSLHKNYKLERMRKLMEALGNPQDTYRAVHVAGTSGKTSTCYYVAALLGKTGKKVGLTVSPHIDGVNERVQINLVPLPEVEFCREFTEFMSVLRATRLRPTYFELLVAFMYWEFARQKVDYAVVEVGVGGLLDGTNVVHRADKVCVIADIGIDHTAVLGKDIASIAAQKAGIMLPYSVAFSHAQTAEIMDVLQKMAENVQAKLCVITDEATAITESMPAFQRRNWSLAKEAISYIMYRDGLGALTAEQLKGTTQLVVPARMEVVNYKGYTLVFDGSHNQQKLHALMGALQQKFPGKSIAVLMGLLEDRQDQLDGALQELTSVSAHIIATSFLGKQDIPRPVLKPSIITKSCKQRGFDSVEAITSPTKAFQALMKRPEDILVVTGSFYLLNTIRPIVLGSAK